jgi:hypothetical protein
MTHFTDKEINAVTEVLSMTAEEKMAVLFFIGLNNQNESS